MKRGTPEHPKVKALASALKCRRSHAAGYLEFLWHFTTKYAPAGDIGRWTDAQIAEACDFGGEPLKLLEALHAVRFIDAHHVHRYIIHDWPDHADDAVHMALGRAGKRFANDSIPKLTRLSEKERDFARRAYAVHMENALPSPALAPPRLSPALIKHTEPKPTRTAAPSLSMTVWEQCRWRPEGRKDALPRIERAIRLVADAQAIGLEDAAAYIATKAKAFTEAMAGTEMRFRPRPAAWFNQGRYDDDPAVWQKSNAPPISPKDQAQRNRELREPEQFLENLPVFKFGGGS